MPAGKACAGNELARSVRKARSMSGGPDSARQRAALALPGRLVRAQAWKGKQCIWQTITL